MTASTCTPDPMYVCLLDQADDIVVHKILRADPKPFLQTTKPYRAGLVVAPECMFAWYWRADLCQDQSIPFVRGHALYMEAIHGDKTKYDKIDSHKIAALLRSGNLAQAY